MADRSRVALIAGGAGGIGRAAAGRFHAAGWDVTIGDIDETAASTAAAALGVGHTRLDVCDPSSVREFLHSVPGPIDVVVNCVGVFEVAPLLEHRLDAWRKVFAVNVEGALNLIQCAGPLMADQPAGPDGCRGRMVNLSSPSAAAPRPFLPAYGASKAALDHLSRTAAAILGPAGVWVIVVYPTNVAEGMWARLPAEVAAVTGQGPEQVTAQRLSEVPSGGFQPARDVADVLYYSATAPGMNGKLIWSEAHVADL